MTTRVVLTHAGVLSPLGMGWHAFADTSTQPHPTDALGKRLQTTNLDGTSSRGAALPHFAPEEILGRKGLRTLDRNTRMVLACIEQDLAAWLATQEHNTVGLVIGTDFGSYPSLRTFTQTYDREGFRALNPRHFPNLVINSPPSQGNIRFALTASSTTIANGTNSGFDAVQFAATHIQEGMATSFICGGAEELSPALCVGWDAQGQLSTSEHIRPFGAMRDGTLPSEGAALFAMTSRAVADAQQAPVLAELLAWSSHFDSAWGDQQKPSADAAYRTIMDVLEQAALSPQDIDFISASANGSIPKDAAEAEAITRIFQAQLPTLPILVQGHLWGHAGGATSALQLAGALASLTQQRIPAAPTTHDSLCLPTSSITQTLQRGLLISLDEYGGASALLIQHPSATKSHKGESSS